VGSCALIFGASMFTIGHQAKLKFRPGTLEINQALESVLLMKEKEIEDLMSEKERVVSILSKRILELEKQ